MGLIIDVNFLLMKGRLLTLLCMKDMISNVLDISIQNRTITYHGRTQELVLENYFLVYKWGVRDVTYALYTEAELRRIHKVFGHFSADATQKMSKRAKESKLNHTTRSSISKLAEDCQICRFVAIKPRRFKLTVGADGFKFNCRVQVDTMLIRGRPVIHMVVQATHFSTAAFLKNKSATEVW